MRFTVGGVRRDRTPNIGAYPPITRDGLESEVFRVDPRLERREASGNGPRERNWSDFLVPSRIEFLAPWNVSGSNHALSERRSYVAPRTFGGFGLAT